MKEEVWKSFIVLLTNAPELHAYAARALFRALRQHLETAQTSLLATAHLVHRYIHAQPAALR